MGSQLLQEEGWGGDTEAFSWGHNIGKIGFYITSERS